MHTHKVVITSMLLVLFGSTIFQSCQPVDTSAVIYDFRSDATSFGTTFVTQHQNVSYEGNLFINNNETFTIQDSEFYMKGKITILDTSTVIIRNSEFTAITLIVIIIAVLVFFFRKRAKQDQRKRARTSEAKNIYGTVVCPSCKKRFSEEHHQCPWCGKKLLKCKRCGKHISSLEAERYKNYCIECYHQWLQEKTPFF